MENSKRNKKLLSEIGVGEKVSLTGACPLVKNCEVIKRLKDGRIKVKIYSTDDKDFWIFYFPASKNVWV